MLRPVLALVVVLLAACGDRRDFDERFEDTASNLENRAAEIDDQLNAANSAEAGEK